MPESKPSYMNLLILFLSNTSYFRIVEYYVGSIDNYNVDHLYDILDMWTDGFCLYGNYKFAEHLMMHGVTVYQYILSYVGPNTFSNVWANGVDRASHADDLIYLWNFSHPLARNIQLRGDDIPVKDIMTQAWADFATFGNPTPPGSKFSWTPLENTSYFTFWNISGPNPAMAHSDYIQERMELWENTLDDGNSNAVPKQLIVWLILLILIAL